MRQSFYSNVFFLLKYENAFFVEYYIFYIVTFPIHLEIQTRTRHTVLNSFAKLNKDPYIFVEMSVFKHPS